MACLPVAVSMVALAPPSRRLRTAFGFARLRAPLRAFACLLRSSSMPKAVADEGATYTGRP
eukprot:5076279-Prymnesium_polylepis.2